MTAEEKRKAEMATVKKMLEIYCRAHHGNNLSLCEECEALLDYARARVERCPHMETKTFCSACQTHCYAPKMREKSAKPCATAARACCSTRPSWRFGTCSSSGARSGAEGRLSKRFFTADVHFFVHPLCYTVYKGRRNEIEGCASAHVQDLRPLKRLPNSGLLHLFLDNFIEESLAGKVLKQRSENDAVL